MPSVKVYSQAGKELRDFDLAAVVFGIEPNKQAMFDAVIMQRASMRQGTHDTINRTEVRGGGRKPWRQKGTGRARQGSTRSPQWRGGGIVFGPTPRSYAYRLNRKVRRLALRSILSVKVLENSLMVLENLNFETIKTKEFTKVMTALKLETKTLFVVDVNEEWENAFLSMRNLPNVMFLTVEGLNTYDLMNADKVVMTEAAAKAAGEVWA